MGFPGGSVGKESTCNVGDEGSIPGWGRSPGEENRKPLQYPCLGTPLDRGARWAAVHGVTRFAHNLATKPPPLHDQLQVCGPHPVGDDGGGIGDKSRASCIPQKADVEYQKSDEHKDDRDSKWNNPSCKRTKIKEIIKKCRREGRNISG